MTYSSLKKWVYHNNEKSYLDIIATTKNDEIVISIKVLFNLFISHISLGYDFSSYQ